MVELLVTVSLFTIVSIAGFMLFVSGQSIWTMNDVRIKLQDDLRTALTRVSLEVQESGRDNVGTLQLVVSDNIGFNGADLLRFAVPVCPCGVQAITEDGDVKYWGAPSTWGDAGCSDSYTLNANNQVDICHFNPGNNQDMSVDVSQVKGHLSHGDWIGNCNACTPANYTNRWIQYLIINNQLVRRVLNGNLGVISSSVLASNVDNFQVVLNGGQTMASITLQMSDTAAFGRTVSVTQAVNANLRN